MWKIKGFFAAQNVGNRKWIQNEMKIELSSGTGISRIFMNSEVSIFSCYMVICLNSYLKDYLWTVYLLMGVVFIHIILKKKMKQTDNDHACPQDQTVAVDCTARAAWKSSTTVWFPAANASPPRLEMDESTVISSDHDQPPSKWPRSRAPSIAV